MPANGQSEPRPHDPQPLGLGDVVTSDVEWIALALASGWHASPSTPVSR